ncbi:MAG: hypothetical protein JKY19_05250 [Alcanivoracaceae bacterium]|nr:hypothetical protein [Alcanivoracaceae bacterium]
MKVLIFLLLFSSFTVYAIDSEILNETPQSQSPWIVRVYFESQQQVQKLSEITALWQVNQDQRFAVVMIEDEEEFKEIQSLGVKIRIDTPLQNKYFTENKNLKSQNSTKGASVINGFSCYSTVEGTFARMDEMVANFPDLTEIIDIGDSWEKTVDSGSGYDLKVLKITNKNIIKEKPIVFITTAIHAREYTTAELATRFAEYLLAQYQDNSDVRWMLDHQEIQLLLHTNPDGRKKAETGILWRKNTNQAYCSPTSNDRGADLNRNYPFLWQNSNDQCAQVFPGASAESEPEIDAVVAHVKNIYADNRGELLTDVAPDDTPGVFLDIHSFSQLILWPWGFTSNDSPNVAQLRAFGRRVAFFNSYTPEPISDLTIAKGSSVDTTYGELGVASLAFELGTAFFQDCATFEASIFPDNLQALLYVSRVARTPYIAPLGPDIENLAIVPNYILTNQLASIKGTANDDRYNHSHGAQSTNNIQKVDMYIDDLPWLQQGAQVLNANDGSFDQVAEIFAGTINSNQLANGEHIIYTVATDDDDKQGAIYSQFLNIVSSNTVGTLNGRVTNAITGAGIDAVQLSINHSVSLSNMGGDYSMLVPPVTDVLEVNAEGFAMQMIDAVEIMQQQATHQDIQLEPFCSIFTDDIESGSNGWVADSFWSIVTQQSASPSHSWTDSPNLDYANNINTALTSANIDIAGAMSLEVGFDHLCDTEAGFDFGRVEVNFDNSSWQEIMTCSGQPIWQHATRSVPVPANAQQMQMRFRLTSDGFVTADGWYIDDIDIKASGQPCRAFFNDTIYANGFE